MAVEAAGPIIEDADLTPQRIVSELDKYIVGQDDAKRAVAIAIRNRWRRQQLGRELAEEVAPKNIIMIGPTGVGKTEIARRLARLIRAPFIKVEATKYTEVGYVGRDVESMVRDLVELSIQMVRGEQTALMREQAERLVEDRLLDELVPAVPEKREWELEGVGADEAVEASRRRREKVRQQLRSGALDERVVEIRIEEKAVPMAAFSQMGLEQMEPSFQNVFENLIPSRTRERRLPIREARQVLFNQEVDRLIDRDKVTQLGLERAANSGIIFVDELDKVAGSDSKFGPDVSRQGVQRDLLPIVEGSTVATKHGNIRTDHILFIAAGAFHGSKPADLMPELQGRFPIRVELQDLGQEDFRRILTEPEHSLIKQQMALLGAENVRLTFTEDGIGEMAAVAERANRMTQNIGARRLYTVMEKVLDDLSFRATEMAGGHVTIDAEYVRAQLADVMKDEDLSKYIL
ncbi:MAG: ATP-dependent protease ATPase subunit HslU [Phycisphaerae bacterium]|nr:ATP-dependent protease ATPase subunit HslU [Phycisphaerae bacterium]